MKYLVAVSGGIDSVVLLDVLVREAKHELVVMHVNHGIRSDSDRDEELVAALAQRHGLNYEVAHLHLGPGASEELARTKRHEALLAVMEKHEADRVATAHHSDDVLETIALNIVRGTGWRGLCSLRDTETYVRPLLDWSKQQVVAYAIDHGLKWNEDSTNDDLRYLRNYLRAGLVARMTAAQREELLALSKSTAALRDAIEAISRTYRIAHETNKGLSRYSLIMLSRSEAHEVLRSWLGESLTRRRLDDLWLLSKVAHEATRWSLDAHRFIRFTKSSVVVESPRD